MSPTKPKLDPSKILPPSGELRILSDAEIQNLDSDSYCVLVNDTNDTYIASTMESDHWVHQLWGQPPGMNIAVKPGWVVVIWPCNGNNAMQGDSSGYSYGGAWGLTAENGRVFHFSTMS